LVLQVSGSIAKFRKKETAPKNCPCPWLKGRRKALLKNHVFSTIRDDAYILELNKDSKNLQIISHKA
jgi:hypothetical protein